MLELHPHAGMEEKLLRLKLMLRLPGVDLDDILEESKKLFAIQHDEELAELGRWLNKEKLYAQSMTLISPEMALKRQDLFLIRIDAMAMTNQWEAIGEILDSPNVPIEPYINNLFKMRVYLEAEQVRRANLEWDKVLLSVSRDPEKLWFVVEYSLRLQLNAYARTALNKLTEIPSSMRRAYEALLRLEQQTGQTVAMRDILERMGKVYPDEPAVLNDIAYLNLLLGEKVSVSTEKARAMVLENPRYLAHRVTLALGYLRFGNNKDALRLLDGLQINWISVQPRWRVIAALVYQANERYDEAKQIIDGVKPEKLLPQERILMQKLM